MLRYIRILENGDRQANSVIRSVFIPEEELSMFIYHFGHFQAETLALASEMCKFGAFLGLFFSDG